MEVVQWIHKWFQRKIVVNLITDKYINLGGGARKFIVPTECINMKCQALEMFMFYDIRDPQWVTQHESCLSLRVHLGFMFEFNHRNQWKMGCWCKTDQKNFKTFQFWATSHDFATKGILHAYTNFPTTVTSQSWAKPLNIPRFFEEDIGDTSIPWGRPGFKRVEGEGGVTF